MYDLKLDLLAFQQQLKTKAIEGKRHLWSFLRKKYLVLQPEELVRQLLVLYLTKKLEYPAARIAAEKALEVNKLKRRFDLLVMDEDFNPWMLIECKAPKVAINQAVFEQIARYNMTLNVPYLFVSNGRTSYCCEIDYEKQDFTFLKKMPQL